MSVYTFPINIGTTGNTYPAKIGELYKCDGEEYKNSPRVAFSFNAHDIYNNYSRCIASTISITGLSQYDNRVAFSLARFNNIGYVDVENLKIGDSLFLMSKYEANWKDVYNGNSRKGTDYNFINTSKDSYLKPEHRYIYNYYNSTI